MTAQKKRRYALIAGVGAAVLLFMVIRGRSAAPPADELLAVGPAPVVGGSDGSFSEPGTVTDPSAFDTQFQDALMRFGVTDYMGELRGQIKGIEDALEGSGWLFSDGQILPPEFTEFGLPPIDPDWLPPTEMDIGPGGMVPPRAPGNRRVITGLGQTRIVRGQQFNFLARVRSAEAAKRQIRQVPTPTRAPTPTSTAAKAEQVQALLSSGGRSVVRR